MGRPSDAKNRLIEAARNVFFTHSYEGVSVDALCVAAEVNKSSFYHFFPSKQALVLAAIERQWLWFEQSLLQPIFSEHRPPQERLLHFFDLVCEFEQAQKRTKGHVRGCPAGNLALEMSTQNEEIRMQVERFFRESIAYFEQVLIEAKEQDIVPATLDITMTAQALLAYFEGVMLLAKVNNDPALISTLRTGVLALIQYRANQANAV